MSDPSQILAALGAIYDPCCRQKEISVVDMGIIRSVKTDDRTARIDLMLTSGWCPFMGRLVDEVKQTVEALAEVDEADVRVVWDEAWTPQRLSPSAREKLHFLPDPAQIQDRNSYVAKHRASRAGGASGRSDSNDR